MSDFRLEVLALDREGDPRLRFRRLALGVVDFADERGFVNPLPLRLGEVATHGTGGSTDLVGE